MAAVPVGVARVAAASEGARAAVKAVAAEKGLGGLAAAAMVEVALVVATAGVAQVAAATGEAAAVEVAWAAVARVAAAREAVVTGPVEVARAVVARA